MNIHEQAARIQTLLQRKLADERAIAPGRDTVSVHRDEILRELPELPAADAIAIAEHVLEEHFHEVGPRLNTDALGFGMAWFTDEEGLRRRQGG